jgi:hypothetical protein
MVVVVVAVVWGYLPSRPLTAHVGDGEFAETTVRGRLFPGGPSLFDFRGYSVTFPSFDLTADHRAEYRVSRLPEIGRHCTLYLGVDDPGARWFARDQEQRRLQARLRLEVVDEDGEVICLDEAPLGQWNWSFVDGQHRLSQLYGSRFRPSHDRAYVFRLSYTGDERLAGLRGYCYLGCGPKL